MNARAYLAELLGTFLFMILRHGLSAEFNPVVVAVAQDYGLPGLTIAKALAESMGGQMRAASAGPGQGSTFTFALRTV